MFAEFKVYVLKIERCLIPVFPGSSSFKLFVVSFMQEDIYIGHTALAHARFASLQLD